MDEINTNDKGSNFLIMYKASSFSQIYEGNHGVHKMNIESECGVQKTEQNCDGVPLEVRILWSV